MNIAQIEYLAVVAHTQSLAGAARSLYISPQAVKAGIRRLEQEFDVKLIEQKAGGTRLTDAGRRLARKAEDALREIHALSTALRGEHAARRSSFRLRLGLTTALHRGTPVPIRILEAFRKRSPDAGLTIVFHSAETCLAAVSHGALDAAIVPGFAADPELSCSNVGNVGLVALVDAACEFAACGSLSVEDLCGRLVALPTDMRYILPRLVEDTPAGADDISLEPLAPDPGVYPPFFRRGGIVLAYREAPLERDAPDVCAVPFSFGKERTIPIFLATRRANANGHVAELCGFLHSSLS